MCAQGGPGVGLGWNNMFNQPLPLGGMGPTILTNPLRMMTDELTAEVTK